MLKDDDVEEGNLDLPCKPQQLAYCIYTSGSTGKPKGALNTHEGIVNRLLWMQMAYGLDADDVVLQKTPYSFDVSIWEFFWPLITGACLAIADPDAHRDPAQLRAAIERYKVTTVHFVPSMLQAFLDAQPQVNLPTVRRIVCSGEALAAATMQHCLRALPAAALHNLYGPTECAVDVSAWQCTSGVDAVPIGRAIANVRLYVLDEFGQLVPTGVPGELHIAGVAIGRGYLNRVALTAEKFVPDPYGEPGSRMYKTGDLARTRGDGNIEFLGRLDDQVKIRGLRIELGEVEAVLRECEGVREAVVMVREDEPANKRLVAYVRTGDRAAPDVAHLREHLQRTLPDYMVPTAFIVLDKLPLSSNGKIDRKVLPVPEMQPIEQAGYEAPRDDLERHLTEIWAQVLKVPKVGLHDNFFVLGGHSLLATQVIARVSQAGLGQLVVRTLFDSPTIARLAAAIRSLPSGSVTQSENPIGSIPRLVRAWKP
jgi:amino acid adenylation domain-containing protein